ncbi:aldehyde dehydrogenase family protein [Nakamurella antarctica]|uniref:Aldehyde dehydrogenase family protein n=1 Tax=Nakamurella antarctica TaxID=1902245 RepID=A0A3G8ZK95_9ACTN|nr:aldehyde dehydrogenase family protein [Nakamurella antarctica]AZI57742.1 aldehyde dehydrogenase family protein [Nakamurella antarctica]
MSVSGVTVAKPFDGTAPDRPMLIGGQWVEAVAGEWIDVVSPGHRGLKLARVPRAREEDADRAVAAARKAWPAWRDLHFKERQKALLQIADALEKAAEDLAQLTAWDTGNALRPQARPESQTLVNLFRYFGGIAGEFKGTVLPAGSDQLQYTRRESLGVVAGILPWNSPLMIAGMKVPAALAAGNTIVLKAAEDAPLTILLMAEIASKFLPDGVLNVLTGFGTEVGEALVQHKGVDKVSFTGSSRVGHHVAEAAGSRLAHVSLELGGKSPSIVFPDAATDATVDGLLTAMRFTRQGQSCTAGSRLFVHEDVFDDVVGRLVEKVKLLKVGDPLDEATDMGAIINQKQFDQIKNYIEDGRSQSGVRVALDGEGKVPDGLDGFYQAPTIFANVDNSWRIAQEEIFGPVLVAIPWRTRDEVIRMANDSTYGLAAYVWSNKLDEAIDTANRIESGWVQVNQGGGQNIGQSYGGYKSSGIGREFSLEGAMESFTQIKQINVKIG